MKTISIHDVVSDNLGLYVVVDDAGPEQINQVILVPFMWEHRRVVTRAQAESLKKL